MTTIARFIKRGNDQDENKDNAAVMSITEEGHAHIKQDTIYEIREYLGELMIVPIGKTHMDRKRWSLEIQTVMNSYSPLLTEDEMKDFNNE